MELWTGDLKAGNLGPARGDHFLGRVEGPGLYMFVADNAAGKTSLLRVLAALQERELLKTVANITEGETQAYLELAPVRAIFRRNAAPKLEGGELPKITEMPAAIDTLITGDHLKDAEARARRRLGALLGYAPIPLTAEAWAAGGLIERLCDCLLERSFTDADATELADMSPEAPTKGKRARKLGIMLNASDLFDALGNGAPADLLAVHDDLLELLHGCARAAEAARDAADKDVTTRTAGCEGLLDAALRRFGSTVSDRNALLRILRNAETDDARLIAFNQDAMKAREERSALVAQMARANAQAERLEKLRASHGPRPEPDADKVHAAFDRLNEAVTKLATAVFEGDMSVKWDANVGEEDANVRARLSSLRIALDISAIKSDQARWDAIEKELGSTVERMPGDDELEKAARAVRFAEDQIALIEEARLYQAAEAKREAAVTLAGRLATLASDYRKAAKDSWSHLGVAVTETLKLPWLQVDGLDIFLGYVGGKLNDDPELIAAAERAAKATVADELSPVSMRRFLLQRIREASKVEWRALDDEVKVSTGELHSACLAVMLSRREQLGGILILPWKVTAALDDNALRGLARRLLEAGIVGFSERPRRAGDEPGLAMERIVPTFNEPVAEAMA